MVAASAIAVSRDTVNASAVVWACSYSGVPSKYFWMLT